MPTSPVLLELERQLIIETDRVWLDEPDEIVLIRNGVTIGGGGSGGQYFANLVHLEAFMMLLGPHVLYRTLLLADDAEFPLYALKETTLTMFTRPFDQFEFLGDLGLKTTDDYGHRFLEVLAEVDSREDYIRITTAFLTYFNRMFRWVHLIFPWHLGVAYPQKSGEEFEQVLSALGRVSEARA